MHTYKPTYHREKNGGIFSSFVACYRHVFFKFRFQQHCNANFHVKCFRPLKEAICVYVCVCLDKIMMMTGAAASFLHFQRCSSVV